MDTNEILFSKAESYGYRSWFSNESISHSNYPLKNEPFFRSFEDAIEEAKNIDCIWFNGEKFMPALFKVCSENILESLCRLNNLKELIPQYITKYYLVVDDEHYQTALNELLKPTFQRSEILVIKKSELSGATLN